MYLAICAEGPWVREVKSFKNRLVALRFIYDYMHAHCQDRERIRHTREDDGMKILLEDEFGPYRAWTQPSDPWSNPWVP